MSTPNRDLHAASALLEEAQLVIGAAVKELAGHGGVDKNETLAYDIAHASSALAIARACLAYAAFGDTEAYLTLTFLALALSDLAQRVLGRESLWGAASDWYEPFAQFVATYRDPKFLATLAESPGDRHLDQDFQMVADMFHRFAEEQVRPHAEHIHRTNDDIPESIITGLSELGGFGLSVPEEFGGFATGGESEYLGMVIATEELSGKSRHRRIFDHASRDTDSRPRARRHA